MNTIAKLTITRSGYLIELTALGKQLAPGEYELAPIETNKEEADAPTETHRD